MKALLKSAALFLKCLFLPRICCLCGEIADDFFVTIPRYFDCGNKIIRSPFCTSCTNELQKSFGLRKRKQKIFGRDSVFLFDYSHDAVKNLLFCIKTRNCRHCLTFSSNVLSRYFDAMTRDGSDITFLPRNHENFKEYRFDQSQRILEKYHSENHGKKHVKIFVRTGNVPSAQQKTLTPGMRFENAGRTLALDANAEMPSKLVIFDDMITTGATASVACNLVLKKQPQCDIKLIFLAGQRK